MCYNCLKTVLCFQDENFEALIHIPAQIFQYVRCIANECDHAQPFIIEVIVYRKPALFPQISQNSARKIHTAVISAKIGTVRKSQMIALLLI